MFQETVTLTNRTSGPLRAMFDGQRFVFPPGPTPGVPVIVAQFAKDQNPVMGTMDRYEYESKGDTCLLGVEAWGDPISPIEQSDAQERLDRSSIEDEGKFAVPGPKVRVRRSEAIHRLSTDGAEASRQ
jgi:hypothetical protein